MVKAGKSIRTRAFLARLRLTTAWQRRLVFERLTEPIHLNLISLLAAAFGSFRTRVALDLVVRQQYAYPLLRAADAARELGLEAVTVVECGVAAGAGLLNICAISERVSSITGIKFKVVGFDSGEGMPPPCDYRDHPDLYRGGDFPMEPKRLLEALPPNAELILGPLDQTVEHFRNRIEPTSPLGFVSIDVDYYCSTKAALELLTDPNPSKYLPLPAIYLDDVMLESHNSWCGELLAVSEFNAANPMRKIQRDHFLRSRRIFKNARWLGQIYLMHVLDHPVMRAIAPEPGRARAVLPNPYLR